MLHLAGQILKFRNAVLLLSLYHSSRGFACGEHPVRPSFVLYFSLYRFGQKNEQIDSLLSGRTLSDTAYFQELVFCTKLWKEQNRRRLCLSLIYMIFVKEACLSYTPCEGLLMFKLTISHKASPPKHPSSCLRSPIHADRFGMLSGDWRG